MTIVRGILIVVILIVVVLLIMINITVSSNAPGSSLAAWEGGNPVAEAPG